VIKRLITAVKDHEPGFVPRFHRNLGNKLRSLIPRHPSIGDVRGLGLFWAVELVKNKKTKKYFNVPSDKVNGVPTMVEKITGEMMKKGVFLQAWVSHFVIAPPLIIEKQEIDEGVRALDDALAMADEEVEE